MAATPSNGLVADTLALITGDTPYLALYTSNPTTADTGTEVVDTVDSDYARQPITFGAVTNGVASNTNTITFGDMPLTTVTHWAIRDAATGGDLKAFGAFTPSIPFQLHDRLELAAGQISISLTGS